ncbi:MAG: Rieske 2Fe-2S domain-containing protein [Rhodobacteraceae bacterium]|nr:Rieske 2Fe-2S domain-containing protein [Paracoccaceae bacterium]
MGAHSDLDAVMAPVATARGLPNAHYVSDEIFAEERDAVLFKSWSGIGFAKDVPEPGDAKPINFLGMPLVMIRDKTGALGVFQNTCRHRGMILIEEAKKIEGAIRCPYHSWCYALNGDLRATPHVGGPGNNIHDDIKRDELGLIRIRSYVWRDVVFVNISGDAPEFAEVHADLIARWAEFDKPLYHGGPDSSFELTVKSNWKLAVENYCESYHLPWVHPGLNVYSRLEDHYHIEVPGEYSGQGSHVYTQIKGENGEVFPDFPELGSKWDQAGEWVSLFPNVLFGVQRDHAFAILLEPINTSETVEHVEIYYAAPPEDTPELEALRDKNAQQWREIFEEDIFVVEGMQKGRHGVMFDGGKFSPAMDGPTHLFHHWIAAKLAEARG